MVLPAFKIGSLVSFTYPGSDGKDETRTVTFEAMKPSAVNPKTKGRTWLLVGRDGLRDGAYRSFHWAKIRNFRIVQEA